MWILKSTFLGLWLFGFGTSLFLYFAVFRPVESNKATAMSAILIYTTQNPWWWVALVACIAIGCGLVRSWPGKTSVVVWVVLLVTAVIPAGLFSLLAIILSKVKQSTTQ